MAIDYEKLLKRLQSKTANQVKRSEMRLVLPEPDIIWVGNKTIFRNFQDFPKALRREPEKILLYIAKELGSSAQVAGERAIFVGKWESAVFKNLFEMYMKDYVICPVCNSPDTKVKKEKRLAFIICEACGAKSSIKGMYA